MNRKMSRRDFLKLAGVTSAGLALSACGVKATELPTALPTELDPIKNATTPLALEVIPTTEPKPGHPSVVDGLNIGEVTPNNVVGMIPGYESTGINALYSPDDPSMLITKQNGEQVEAIHPRAFGIDQEQLINYFGAVDIDGVKVGSYNGTSVTLKNGIWSAETGEVFIPFIKAEPNTDAVYLVMDANGEIQKVDITGKAIGSPMPMFETPQAIAARMEFEKANDVVDVEMNKNGSLSFITEESRGIEKNPDRTVKVVNEVSFIGEANNLKDSKLLREILESYVSIPGMGVSVDTLLNDDIMSVVRQKTANGKNVDIVEMPFVVGDEQQTKVPLLIREVMGEWQRYSYKLGGEVKGVSFGSNVADFSVTQERNIPPEVKNIANNIAITEFGTTALQDAFHLSEAGRPALEAKPRYKNADKMLALLPDDQKVIAYNLIYGLEAEYNPWLNEFLKTATKQDVLDFISKLVFSTLDRFADKIDIFGVVNEVAERDDVFFKIANFDYVQEAFRAARKADPDRNRRCKLMYNFSNTFDPSKQTGGKLDSFAIEAMHKLMDEDLVDYLGLQYHLRGRMNITEKMVEDHIQTFIDAGIAPDKIILSEFDVRMFGATGNDDEKRKKKAQILQTVVSTCLRMGIKNIIFWEATYPDRFNWLEHKQGKKEDEFNSPSNDAALFRLNETDDIVPDLAYFYGLNALHEYEPSVSRIAS